VTKYTSQNIPREVYQQVEDIIETGGYEYADTFRYSPVDDPEGLEEYDVIRDSGCCGSHDTEVADSTGRVWKVGFNYGH
jgi:hypothetical protein